METNELLKYALIVGVGLGGTAGGWYLALQSRVGKKIHRLEQELVPPVTDGQPHAATYEKIEEIAANVVGLTGDIRGLKVEMVEVKSGQSEIKTQVYKAINDRAEIIDRLSHLEGRGEIKPRRRPRKK